MGPRLFRDNEDFKGYVTTLSAMLGRSPGDIEGRLGFKSGSLKDGYHVYALADPVRLGEFEWKDRTTYSDGWHFDPSISEYVQRQDELRAELGKQNAYDENATDRAILLVMKLQLAKLNVRSGPERIIKVVANSSIGEFPDSHQRNISQWKLKVAKRFVRMAA